MTIVVATLNAKFIHTSLALRCLKAHCAPAFTVHIAEYTIHDPPMHIAMNLFAYEPKVLGFSVSVWNIEPTIVVLRMMRKLLPNVVICLGGPEVSYDTEYWMERLPEVDVIVQGEGEATFLHLLEQLHEGRTVNELHYVWGCTYRSASGTIVVQPPRPKVPLDELATPHRFVEDQAQLGQRIVYFETSRGCPFSCQFCLSSIETGVRYVSLERAQDDLLYLINSGATVIKFVDRTFNLRKAYALALFQFLAEKHGGRCVFQFEITADILHPEVLQWLVTHAPPGVFRFEIGVQSTNERTNALIQRKQRFEKLERTVSALRASERVVQHLDLIAGLPEEDETSFQKTFDDVFGLRPDELQLGFLKMLRGTGLRRDAARYGYVYCDTAPYEVLGHATLSFVAMTRMKRVEDMLEKYWNAHRTDQTIEYVLAHHHASAYQFFLELGTFWEQQGWSRMGHQLEALYVRLEAFFRSLGMNEGQLSIVRTLLTWDYVLQHRYRPRVTLFPEENEQRWRAMVRDIVQQPHTYRALPRRGGKSETPEWAQRYPQTEVAVRAWRKTVYVYESPFDVHAYAQTGRIVERPTIFFASYDGVGMPSVYAQTHG